MMNVDNSKTNGSSRVTIIFFQKLKNIYIYILQQQQFIESLAERLGTIRIPSSVMTFAVIRSLGLMRHVAATNRFECTENFFWKSLSLQQNIVAATSRTNSVWFYFFLTCCSDILLLRRQRFSPVHSKRFVAATCRLIVLLQLVARLVHMKWSIAAMCFCNLSPSVYWP